MNKEEHIQRIIAEYIARAAEGPHPGLAEEVLRRYPQYFNELLAFFAAYNTRGYEATRRAQA